MAENGRVEINLSFKTSFFAKVCCTKSLVSLLQLMGLAVSVDCWPHQLQRAVFQISAPPFSTSSKVEPGQQICFVTAACAQIMPSCLYSAACLGLLREVDIQFVAAHSVASAAEDAAVYCSSLRQLNRPLCGHKLCRRKRQFWMCNRVCEMYGGCECTSIATALDCCCFSSQ